MQDALHRMYLSFSRSVSTATKRTTSRSALCAHPWGKPPHVLANTNWHTLFVKWLPSPATVRVGSSVTHKRVCEFCLGRFTFVRQSARRSTTSERHAWAVKERALMIRVAQQRLGDACRPVYRVLACSFSTVMASCICRASDQSHAHEAIIVQRLITIRCVQHIPPPRCARHTATLPAPPARTVRPLLPACSCRHAPLHRRLARQSRHPPRTDRAAQVGLPVLQRDARHVCAAL